MFGCLSRVIECTLCAHIDIDKHTKCTRILLDFLDVIFLRDYVLYKLQSCVVRASSLTI